MQKKQQQQTFSSPFYSARGRLYQTISDEKHIVLISIKEKHIRFSFRHRL